MNDKFTISKGQTKGSKQVMFWYVSKVTLEELLEMVKKEFPDTSFEKLTLLPGSGYCTITTGKDLEVPQK